MSFYEMAYITVFGLLMWVICEELNGHFGTFSVFSALLYFYANLQHVHHWGIPIMNFVFVILWTMIEDDPPAAESPPAKGQRMT